MQSLRQPKGTRVKCAQDEHGEAGGARMRGRGGNVQTTIIAAPQCRHRKDCGAEGLLATASPELEAAGEIGAEGGALRSARAVAR